MNIPDNLLKYVQSEARRIHHGRITIELNETSNKMDVIVESRERFNRAPQSEKNSESEK